MFLALASDRGGALVSPMFTADPIDLNTACITFDNFLTKTPFAPLMRKVLRMLENDYGKPVDVEFAWDDNKLYILQCRPLAIREDVGEVVLPTDVPKERIIFHQQPGCLGRHHRGHRICGLCGPQGLRRIEQP